LKVQSNNVEQKIYPNINLLIEKSINYKFGIINLFN